MSLQQFRVRASFRCSESHPGGSLCLILVTERAQTSNFPKLQSDFGSIFWKGSCADWRCRFCSFLSNGWNVQRDFVGTGGNPATVFVGIMALGSPLSSGWKSVAMSFLEDTARGKDHPSNTVKKEQEKKPSKPTENIWVWCCKPTGKLCVLCVLTSWPYKISPIFSLLYFPRGKKPQHLIQRLSHEKGSRRCLIYAVMSNFGHGTSENCFPPPSF